MKRNGRGVTLLELLLATTLIGVVGLSFGFLYVTAQRFLIQSVNITSSQEEASFALEHIKRRLLQATAITVPTENNSVTLLPTAPAVVFEFEWQRRNPPGTGVLEIMNSTYRLNLNNGPDPNLPPVPVLEFQRTVGGTFEIIARGIREVTFTRTGRTIVEVVLTSRRASGGETRETELQTIVKPRGM